MIDPCGDSNASIADQLTEHGWSVSPGYFSVSQTSALLAESVASRTQFHRAGVGRSRDVRAATRSDAVLWLEDALQGVGQTAYLEAMEGMRSHLNQTLYLGLFSFAAHFASYPVGAFYARHLDALHGPGARRMLSCILYLNPEWSDADGGHLRLYLDGAEADPFVDVRPEAGTLVTFFSDRFEHEVLPATRGRSSVTGWFSARD